MYQARCGHAAVSFGNSIYLIGGETLISNTLKVLKNDVYKSTDNGLTWDVVTHNAPFSARGYHSVIRLGEKMILFGGITIDQEYSNEVWISSNRGFIWETPTGSSPMLTPRTVSIYV